jgi:glycosyltransferase involved in cell wall biosynthesis
MELISVIMPTYNAAKWVAGTIDSLATQTYRNFELIVSDDGSQDDTVAVVRDRLMKGFQHPWQVIESGTNKGPSAARNLGLQAAKGTWIQYLDSDDLIAPTKFEIQAAHCARASADVAAVYSPWCQCHIDDGRVTLVGRPAQPNMDGRAPIMCLVGPDRVLQAAGLTRRAALEQIGGWDEQLRFWECEEVTFRIAKAGRLECVPSASPLYLWRQHCDRPYIGDRKARYHTIPVAMGWIDLILKGLDYKSLDQAGLPLQDRQDILTSSTYWARELFRADRSAFRTYLAKARQLDPNLAPTYPAMVASLARHIGYEPAETLAAFPRGPKRLLRRLLRRPRPKWPQ